MKRQIWIAMESSIGSCVLGVALYFELRSTARKMKSKVEYASKEAVIGFDKTVKFVNNNVVPALKSIDT